MAMDVLSLQAADAAPPAGVSHSRSARRFTYFKEKQSVTPRFITRALVLTIAAFAFAGTPLWAQLQFVPVTPCRVADTRNADGPFGGPTLGTAETRSFTVPQSACSIPTTALAYSLNVTVVPEGFLGYLALWPTGQAQPVVSTLNSLGGAIVANAAIVPAGAGGAVSVYVTDPSDVILDINGYFDTSTGATSYSFYPATPCRIADTRNATGAFGGPTMRTNQSRSFPIPQSSCDIPAAARAYSLNATVVPQGSLGYLSAWPTGQAQPLVSTLNSPTGSIVANAAIVPAGTNEAISVFVTNPTDVILDTNGYFAAPGGTNAFSFYPVTPCRIADTRGAAGPFGGPIMGAGQTRSFTIPASACHIPSTAAAYSLNVTVVPDGPLYYLSAWPTGATQPLVSTLNSNGGSVLANAAIVPAGTDGAIDVYVTNQTHVVLDINGYFASSGGGGTTGSLVAERALAQTGLSIALASNTLASQGLSLLGLMLSGSGVCKAAPDGTWSLSGGSNMALPLTTTLFYDANCTQPYIEVELTALTNPNGNTDVAILSETVTYYGLDGGKLGTMSLTATDDSDSNVLSGVGVFTPASGAKTPVQLGLYCTDNGTPTSPCVGAVVQDFPALDLAMGAATTLNLTAPADTDAITFTGGGSPVSGPIGSLTLANPSETSLVIQGGTVYTSITTSGGAGALDLFPPTPTGWTVTAGAHDQKFQISVIDDTTRNSNLTITQVSTGKTLATGTVDRSGTGIITYSDGSTAAITAWTLAD